MYIGRIPTSVPLSANDVPDLPASKITSGQFSNSLIRASSVSQHATKNHFLAGALIISNNAVVTISGGELTII